MPNTNQMDEGTFCQRCGAERVIEIYAKHGSDLAAQYHDADHRGYNTLGLSNLDSQGIDHLFFDYCLECGQIQGEWPAPEPEMMY